MEILRISLGPENNIRILPVVIQLEVGDKVSLCHALILAAGRPVPPADLRHGAVKEVAIVVSSNKPGISLYGSTTVEIDEELVAAVDGDGSASFCHLPGGASGKVASCANTFTGLLHT